MPAAAAQLDQGGLAGHDTRFWGRPARKVASGISQGAYRPAAARRGGTP
jgi:hypothetical protein